MTGVLAAAERLAENNFGDTRSGSLAGPMGLLIILLLAVATVLLIRNMNMRLRRLPTRFPDQDGGLLPDQRQFASGDRHSASDGDVPESGIPTSGDLMGPSDSKQ